MVANLLELSVPERILAVEQLWDSIAARPSSVPVTRAQRLELDQRLKALESDAGAGSPWSEVRVRIERRPKR